MKFTREVCGIVYESCAGHCYYCGRSQPVFGDWEIEHMTPRQQGGTDDFYNLALACKTCNRKKGNRTVEQFRSLLLQRVLNNLTDTIELFMEFEQPPDSVITQAIEQIITAQDNLFSGVIRFCGELNNFPRNNDPRFAVPDEQGDSES